VIEAVLFDGDQTLWDFEKVMHHALLAVLDEFRSARPGPFADALSVSQLQDDRRAVADELAGIEFNLARLRVLGFGRTLERRRRVEGTEATAEADADADLAERLTTVYFERRDRDPALFSDVIPCLNALRPRYRLGLLSNGSRLPGRVGLGGYFESVVFAQDHRVVKPDKGIFEVSERELGVGSAGCALVGDHPLNDVVGAKRAGWYAVWLDRDAGTFEHPTEGDERPDAVVTSLDDLPRALDALSRAETLKGRAARPN
jgi:FMN hydrolase / 5-amino-6-(5-phospho-D-ribitylamino)uracil phosphatase